MKKKLSFLLLLCLFGCLFNSCDGGSFNSRPLKVAVTAYPSDALTYVARDMGFFNELGLSVELIFCKEMHEARRLFELGKIDGIFDVIEDEIKRQAQGSGSKIVFIEDISQISDAIIARKGIKRIKDLKGLTVGVDAPYSSSHVFMKEALSANGLNEWDVFFKMVDATEAVSALERGEVDALHTWEPTLSQALKKGYVRLADAKDYPYLITDIIAFSAEARTHRSKDIVSFLNAYLAAQKYFIENRNDALEIIAKNTKALPEDIDAGLRGVQLGDVELNRELMLKNVPPFHSAIVRMMDFYDRRGLMSKTMHPAELFDSIFIREIK